MGIGTAIFWLAALTVGVIIHVRRDSRRYVELRGRIEEGW